MKKDDGRTPEKPAKRKPGNWAHIEHMGPFCLVEKIDKQHAEALLRELHYDMMLESSQYLVYMRQTGRGS